MNGEGTLLFNALDTDPRWHEPAPPGDYVSTAWMPANLLNEGFMTVEAAVRPRREAASTRQQIRRGLLPCPRPRWGDSARGAFMGNLRGAIRPLLEWTTEEQ